MICADADRKGNDGEDLIVAKKNNFIREWLNCEIKEWAEKIKEINNKYRKPRIKMTPLVRISLLALRLYLIILVIILIYKFYLVTR
jgi:hypothetical protein